MVNASPAPESAGVSLGNAVPPIYTSDLGAQFNGDSRELMALLPPNSVDLILTSPPFALVRKKKYGNEDEGEYVAWLSEFGRLARPILRDTGSFVLDLGGAYRPGAPVRSLYNYRILLEFCDSLGYHLAEEFFWHNPAKLPSPIEWVNKRKIRAKDSVNTIWWFSKTEFPKANVRNVLNEYSGRMRALLKDPKAFYRPKSRPSEHQIGASFAIDNGGAIPSNLLQFPNTESTSHYLRTCRMLDQVPHPARFPSDLPRFFIRFLTEPGDLVLDIFSGSNTTGAVAEQERRSWLSFELDRSYAQLSALRFMEHMGDDAVATIWRDIQAGTQIHLDPAQGRDPTSPPGPPTRPASAVDAPE
ncbi:MAG: site-specific DNA-methyltransferase [Chloroflexota bacterium]|nr:site-specific DNA-methyltransferase [Chloroflexota bacterium]